MTRSDKLEAFSAKECQKFTNWIEKFEIHLKREKLTSEEDKIDELFFYLEGEPLDWFQERKAIGSLPETLTEIRELLNEKFGTGIQRICKMEHGDLMSYVRQFEEITLCLPARDDIKVKLFKNGLDSRLYPIVAGISFKSYQEIKTFVQDCFERMKDERPESLSVFRAKSFYKHGNRQDSLRLQSREDDLPRERIWSEEENRLYAEGRCFLCKRKGHRARWCPENGSTEQRRYPRVNHLNVQGQH